MDGTGGADITRPVPLCQGAYRCCAQTCRRAGLRGSGMCTRRTNGTGTCVAHPPALASGWSLTLCSPPGLSVKPLWLPFVEGGQSLSEGSWCIISTPRIEESGKGPQRRLDRRLEEVSQAVGGRLLSVTNAIEAGTCTSVLAHHISFATSQGTLLLSAATWMNMGLLCGHARSVTVRAALGAATRVLARTPHDTALRRALHGAAPCAVRKVGYLGPDFSDDFGTHRVPLRSTAPDSYSVQKLRC